MLEQLETRRALAVFYRGVQQSNTTSADESFNYIVDVDSTGTGELWIRYEALQDRIDIADNPGFGTVSNTVVAPRPGFFGPAVVPQSIPAPLSLEGLVTVRQVEWNKIGEKENFSSGALTIRAETGTRVFIANGDSLPLALRFLNGANGGHAASGTVDGPIDSSVNPYASSPTPYNNWLTADTVTVRASMKTASVTQLYADQLISLQNVIISPATNAYVGNGDFQVIAGARIDGNVGVYLGQQGGSGVGFGASGGDILIDGAINGASVTLNTNSLSQPVAITTGPSGLISGTGSLTLFNSGLDGGRIDVRSAGFSVTNVSAGTGLPGSGVPDIGVAIEQTVGNLRVNAVPKSRGRISLSSTAPNSTIAVGSNIDTEAALSLNAPVLDIKSPIRTTAGDVTLEGDTVTIGSNVSAGTAGVGAVRIKSRTGGVTVSSAAVVSAADEIITIDAKTAISSLARLEARALDLTAGTSLNVQSNAKELTATAATGIVIDNVGSLLVRSATTTGAAGTTAIAISSQGSLDVASASARVTGGIMLDAATGLRAKELRTKSGSVALASSDGDVQLDGTVVVEGAASDLSLAAAKGNVIIDPTAILTIADQVAVSAPLGRVLTPGQVTGVAVTNGGSGYTSTPTVSLDAGSGGVAAPVVAGGAIAGFEVLNGGAGYVTAPKVRLVGGGGTNAAAQAFITNGVVTRVVVTNAGTGYTSAPQVVFFDGSGSGAEANALINGLSAISVMNAGAGYLVPPKVVVSSGAGATAAPITIDATGGITAINVSTGGSGYGLPPRVEIVDTSGSGFGAAATATLTTGVTGFSVTNPGSGYTSAPTVTLTGGGGTGATAAAIISGSVVTGTLSVTTGGAGYAPNPLVLFTGTGTGAAGTATISGSVVSLTVSNGGSGYSAVPTVALVGGGGGGATATASLGLTNASFTVTNVPELPNGNPATIPTLYSAAPTVAIVGGGGTGATATATLDANGLVTGIQITNPGTGYTTAPTVTLSGGTVSRPGTNPTATANAVNFTVSGLTITNAGSGYAQNPAVTFTGGGGAGTVATALIRGAITSVQITNGGSGYSAAPTISFADSVGTGAVGPATTINAAVINLQILTPGSGYSSAPSVTFSGGGGSGAVATVSVTSVVTGITVNPGQKGANYNPATTSVRLVPVSGGDGAVAGAISVDRNGSITRINVATEGQDYVVPPTVIITDSSGSGSGAAATATLTAGRVTSFTITSPGSKYNPETTTVTLVSKGGGTTAVANLDSAGRVASVTVTNPGSGYDPANPPNVRLVPYGENAAATATIGGGAVTGFTVTNPGRYYAVPPKVTLTGGGGTGATGTAVISNVATINANRLSWTALESPLDALSSQFGTLAIHLTGDGDVRIDKKAGTVVLEGASTTNGSVFISAPVLSVKGAVTIGDFDQRRNKDVELRATAGDLTIDAAVGNLLAGSLTRQPLARTVSLSAPAGSVTSTATPAGLVTAQTLVVNALSNSSLRTDVDFIRGGTTSVGAGITITQNALDANGNPLNLTIGNANGGLTANAGTIRVTAADQIIVAKPIDAGSGGTVILTAGGRIVEAVANGSADILADTISLESTSGKIDLDTATSRLTARAGASTIDIDNVAAAQVELVSMSSRNGIRVSSPGTVVVTNLATTNGPVAINTAGTASDITVGRIAAPAYPITLNAGRSIVQQNSGAASLVGSDAALTAQAGALDVFVDVVSVSASAPETISIRDAGSLQVAGAVSSNNKQIAVTVGGTLSQSAPIRTGGSLVISASAGDVVLSNAANDVGSLTASNLGRGVTFRDANGFDIGTGGITGGAVDLTVGGPLTQTGAVRASSLAITSTAGGPITFNNSANNVDTIAVNNVGNDITFTDVDGVTVGNFFGRDIRLNVGGAIAQAATAGITATGLLTINFTGTKQPITLNGLNDLTRFSIDNGSQPVTLNDINSLEIGAITAGAVVLTVGGNLTQTGAIVAPSLTASSTGGVIVLDAGNDVGSLSITNASRAVTFRDVNALGIAGLTGSTVQLTVGGGLTQSGAISATALRVDASAGDIALTNAGNAIGSIAGSNPGRAFSVANTGNLAQSAGIVAGTLSVSNTAGSVLLNAANDVDNLAINNGAGAVGFTDVDGVSIIGLTGGAVTLAVGGPLTQTGRIAASSLQAFASAGSIGLTRDDNAVSGAFTATAPAGNVSFTNASGLTAGRVEAGTAGPFNGNVTLKAVSGNIQLTDDVIALDDTVKLEARNGTISQTAGKTIASAALVWFAQAAPTLTTTATAVGRNLTQPGTPLAPIVDNSFGTVTVYDSSASSGNIVVNAPNASQVIIAGVLVPGAGGRVDLRGVNPNAVLKVQGDGDLQGVQILVPRSTTTFTWIVSGPTAADAGTALVNAITHANSVMPRLATQAGARIVPIKPIRPSTIDASAAPVIDVQQSLPALNVPVTFVTPTTIRAVGGTVSGSGLRLGPGASGSQIANLAFQGFGGTGIELDRVQRARVQGVSVTGGSAGLSVAGASNGTIVVGNTFRNVQTGLVLSSASRLTFGGRRAGEANRIENATREAVFSTGFATGTQLIKTQYVGGSSAIVTRNVRGLKVVK